MIQHIVLCKIRAEVSADEVAAIWAALDAVRDVVPGMGAASFGENVSPEGLARGYTHGFVIAFEDAAARDAYLVAPEHKAAGARLVAACEGGVEGVSAGPGAPGGLSSGQTEAETGGAPGPAILVMDIET